jgi:hypothetical protein
MPSGLAILRWVLRLSVVLVGVTGGFVAAFAVLSVITGPLPPPYGDCSSDYTDAFAPALGPGAPQTAVVKRAIAYVREERAEYPDMLEGSKVDVQDWGDDWQVHFLNPYEKDFFGCVIWRFDGSGPTVWIRKKDMTPYRID